MTLERRRHGSVAENAECAGMHPFFVVDALYVDFESVFKLGNAFSTEFQPWGGAEGPENAVSHSQ